MIELILASQSPRRRQLLSLTGCPYQVTTADVDETSITTPDPAQNAMETAVLKAEAVADALSSAANQLLLTADTIVALDDRMLGKPADAAAATAMLRRLRGRSHQVHTGVCLIHLGTNQVVEGVHTAVVTMRHYTDAEIAAYVASGDPLDKAGAYAIQHSGFRPAARLAGCYLGVMGLSICHLLLLLPRLGVAAAADLTAVAAAHEGYPCPLLRKLGD